MYSNEILLIIVKYVKINNPHNRKFLIDLLRCNVKEGFFFLFGGQGFKPTTFIQEQIFFLARNVKLTIK